jgi:glucose dehydrogenase
MPRLSLFAASPTGKARVGVHSRVFVGNGPFLLALDVATGKPAPGFGGEGRLDLKQGVLGDLKDGRYALQSPPAIFGDVVIRIEQRRRLTDRGRLRRRAGMGRPNGQVAVDLSGRSGRGGA